MPTKTTRPPGLGALAQRVILCNLKAKAADKALKDAKEELDAAHEAILAEFAANGVTSVKYKGYTVYTHDQIFGSLNATDNPEGPKVDAMKALAANGLGWMIKETVPAQTLHAWVREQPVDKQTLKPKLPASLVPHIKVSTKPYVGTKKS